MFGFVNKKKTNVVRDLKKEESEIRARTRNSAALAEKLRLLAKDAETSYPLDALRLMRESNELAPHVSKQKWIGFRLYNIGNLEESYAILSKLPQECFTAASEKRRLQCILYEYASRGGDDAGSQSSVSAKGSAESRMEQTDFSGADTASFEIVFCNGQRFYQKSGRTVAVISDEEFQIRFADTACLKYISLADSLAADFAGIDLLLVASPWLGTDGSWYGNAFPMGDGAAHDRLTDFMKQARSKGIPIVFYSLETVSQFSSFSDYAEFADYVYVSDRASISLYREKCPRAKTVEFLPYGINPLLCNPQGMHNAVSEDNILYAGFWKSEDKRQCAFVKECLEELNAGGKTAVFDANTIRNEDSRYEFPDSLRDFITDSVDGLELFRIFRRYPLALVLGNSDARSQQIPGRCFELLASGCLTFFGLPGNDEIARMLPMAPTGNTASDLMTFINGTSLADLQARRISGIRAAMKNTCYDCMNRILSNAGLEQNFSLPRILVAGSDSPRNRKSFDRQTYKNRVFVSVDELTPALLKEYDAIAWFSDDIYYDSCYLEDMLNAFKYTDVSFVTKDSYLFMADGSSADLVCRKEHEFIDVIRDKAKSVFWLKDWDGEELLGMPASENEPFDAGKKGVKGYSPDHASLCSGYEQYVRGKTRPPYRPYLISVVIPLPSGDASAAASRIFSAVSRSASFSDMEIIFAAAESDRESLTTSEDFIAGICSNARFCFSESEAFLESAGALLASAEPSGEYVLIAGEELISKNDILTELARETRVMDFDAVLGMRFKSILSDFRHAESGPEISADDEVIVISGSQYRLSPITNQALADERMPVLLNRDFLNNSGMVLDGAAPGSYEFLIRILSLAGSVKFTDVL